MQHVKKSSLKFRLLAKPKCYPLTPALAHMNPDTMTYSTHHDLKITLENNVPGRLQLCSAFRRFPPRKDRRAPSFGAWRAWLGKSYTSQNIHGTILPVNELAQFH